jgi:2-Cys peroxiredoxin 5
MTIAVGSKLPSPPKSLWESAPENSVTFPSSGKFVLLGVPGAFTRNSPPTYSPPFFTCANPLDCVIAPCSSQVPGYISHYPKFADKGVVGIYVVAVNDVFVVKAWKESLEGGKDSKVHFVADCTGIPLPQIY